MSAILDHVRPDWNKVTTPAPNPARAASRRNSASAGAGGGGSGGGAGGASSRSNNLLRATGILTRPGRSASSAAATQYNQYLTNMRDINMDLEDWMVMEAVRLSLAEQEENERKAAVKKSEEDAKNNKYDSSTSAPVQVLDQTVEGSSAQSPSSSTSAS